jgi:hypothetical protein
MLLRIAAPAYIFDFVVERPAPGRSHDQCARGPVGQDYLDLRWLAGPELERPNSHGEREAIPQAGLGAG